MKSYVLRCDDPCADRADDTSDADDVSSAAGDWTVLRMCVWSSILGTLGTHVVGVFKNKVN